MAGKREKPEDIVLKLRQVEVLQGQGKSVSEAVRQIGVCQRQSKSGPKGSAKCCHFGGGIISVQTSASIRAAALVI